MNLKPTLIGLALATSIGAPAQETNQVLQTDYAAFRVISERNIFNPYREPGRTTPTALTTPTRIGEAFSLVGTMNYGKGDFAFFDGANSEYRRIVRSEGLIAGYTVTEITPHGVELQGHGQKIELKVGAQMRRDEAGGWRLIAACDLPAAPADSGFSGEANDVLKKLMQKREQELK